MTTNNDRISALENFNAKTGCSMESIKERQKEEAGKHENYRTDVHKRFGNTGNRINELQANVMEHRSIEARRVDSIEARVDNSEKISEEIKAVFKELVATVSEIKEYIVQEKAGRSTARQFAKFIVQLAAFAVTLIAIIKYFKIPV